MLETINEPQGGIAIWYIIAPLLINWFLVEISFAVIFYAFLLPRFQKLSPPEDYRDYARDRRQLLIRILERHERVCRSSNTPLIPTIRAYVKEYFHPSDPLQQVPEDFWPRKGDMDQFFAWAFFGKHRDDLEEWMLTDMGRMYATFEARYGLVFDEGVTPDMKPMRLTLDPLDPSYRPFLIYFVFWLLKFMASLLLRGVGFYYCQTSGGLRYWYRPGRPSTEPQSALPLLFLHGIAPGGVALYLPMLFFLGRDGRPLLFFENPSISFDIQWSPPPNERETTAGVWEAVDRHLGSSCHVSLVGHSFGSCPITWLIHSSQAKARIRQIVLVDPVSILLSEPDVMCNFLYARETLQKRPRYRKIGVVSNEIFTENYLRRHFAWYNSELWLEDLPVKAKVLVCLSEQDQILPARKVQREVDRLLRDPDQQDVDLLVWEGAGHAHCVTRPRTWRQIQLVMKRQERLILEEAAAAKTL
jgi:hypothetical protein